MNETRNEGGATFRFGTVSAVDAKTCRVRVRLPDYDNMRTAWLPVLAAKTQDDKDYWLPDVGEQVVALLDERGEDGVVLGAVYSSADAPPVASGNKRHIRFSDGTTAEYDRSTHKLAIHCVGDVDITASGDIRLNGANIRLNEGG
ncbi:MAG: phage baseplate assembly protein V [Candidatus Accumulibacter sp.]|jgi:phage baseplate assembly protein V|nr:phage baseplate assembly protein V [Accumulibacter sp.]